jgi:hypothetical protein
VLAKERQQRVRERENILLVTETTKKKMNASNFCNEEESIQIQKIAVYKIIIWKKQQTTTTK